MIRVPMLNGPELEVNPRHVAIIGPPPNNLVGACLLVFATPTLTPTVVKIQLDEAGRRFGFKKLRHVAGPEAYINPLHVAQVMPELDKGKPVLGRSIVVFASPTLNAMPAVGSPDEIAKVLDADAGPALVVLGR
jgi:hypothetical protein